MAVSVAEQMSIRAGHVLRKYNPLEWGGTETAVKELLDGLKAGGVENTVYCPRLETAATVDPLAESGHTVRRFRAVLPVWGISPEQRRQLIAVGGNLLSAQLFSQLMRQPELSVIHAHSVNRLGATAFRAARLRGLPTVLTIHGGILDLPAAAKRMLAAPLKGGFDWGRLVAAALGLRHVIPKADAILTANPREAELLERKYPRLRIVRQPLGVNAALFASDHRDVALQAFPQLAGREVLLCVARIDPVKNQAFLVQELGAIVRRHPRALLVLAGASLDEAYDAAIRREIERQGLQKSVLFTGNLPPKDPRLIGLYQTARVLLLPSTSETFGLVILEAWASGCAVIASRTTGASALIGGDNGWLFDLDAPAGFHEAVEGALSDPQSATARAAAGKRLAREQFDNYVLADRVKRLYEELVGSRKHS